jgi:hypothetical protein
MMASLAAHTARSEDLFAPAWRGSDDSTYTRFDCDDEWPDEEVIHGDAAWSNFTQLWGGAYSGGKVQFMDPLWTWVRFPSSYDESTGEYAFPDSEAIVQVTTYDPVIVQIGEFYDADTVDVAFLGDRTVYAFTFTYDGFTNFDPMNWFFSLEAVAGSATVDQIIVDIRAVPTPEPADLDGDGLVDNSDLFQLLGAWGPCPDCPEDLNGDDDVNADDLFQLLGAWGPV